MGIGPLLICFSGAEGREPEASLHPTRLLLAELTRSGLWLGSIHPEPARGGLWAPSRPPPEGHSLGKWVTWRGFCAGVSGSSERRQLGSPGGQRVPWDRAAGARCQRPHGLSHILGRGRERKKQSAPRNDRKANRAPGGPAIHVSCGTQSRLPGGAAPAGPSIPATRGPGPWQSCGCQRACPPPGETQATALMASPA